MVGEIVRRLCGLFCGIEKRLRWNATNIKTGAAKRRLAIGILPVIHTCGIKSQLGTAYRGNISTGSGADHYHIESIAHGGVLEFQ